MDTPSGVTVFLSHSHHDKVVARRLRRELGAHGFRAWLDEREVPLGATLTLTLRRQIEAADVVLVVASAAAADSTWVCLEIEHARAHGRPVVPLFVEPVTKREPFRDHKGIDIVSPQAFGRTLLALMRDVMQSFDRELPPADPSVLEAGLRALAVEEPAIEPLILGCLDGEGMNPSAEDSVFTASFHALDHALNALQALRPTESTAGTAARAFLRSGAGFDAMRQWIARTGDGGIQLVFAVGERLDAGLLTPALELLAACSLPNNYAHYRFFHGNADQLDASTQPAALRLVTWPRRGPDRQAATLGRAALQYFPDAEDVRKMWLQWIHEGQFDGKPGSPRDLARELGVADELRLPGWGPVQDALRNHVRGLLRRPSRDSVWTAIAHLKANADESTPVLDRLVREMEGLASNADWDEWKQEDPRAVEEMHWFLHMHVREAQAERNWLRATREAERMVEFERMRRSRRQDRDDSSS
jgi:hypothetical protein